MPPRRQREGSSSQAVLFHLAPSAVAREGSFERGSPELPFSLTETLSRRSPGYPLLETKEYFSQNKQAGKAYLKLDIKNNLLWNLFPQQSATKNKESWRSINHWQKDRKYIAFINQMEQGKNEGTALQIAYG